MKRLPTLRQSTHSAPFAIITGIVAQLLAAIFFALVCLLVGSLTPGPERNTESLLWMGVLATLSVGPQVTLVLRQGDWKQKLGATALYAICSFGFFYVLAAAVAIVCALGIGGFALLSR